MCKTWDYGIGQFISTDFNRMISIDSAMYNIISYLPPTSTISHKVEGVPTPQNIILAATTLLSITDTLITMVDSGG